MPEPLQQLLQSKQALEIIPGVLYFASLLERLEPVGSAALKSPQRYRATASFRSQQKEINRENGSGGFAATTSLNASLSAVSGRSEQNISVRNNQQQPNFFSPQVSFRCACSKVAPEAPLLRTLLLNSDSDSEYGGVFENGAFYFSLGEGPAFQYYPFFADFGPLGLDCVTRLSRVLEGLLGCCAAYVWSTDSNGAAIFGQQRVVDGLGKKSVANGVNNEKITPIVFCSGTCNYERANAACLLACFCVATLRWSALDTFDVFQNAYPPIISFRDASYSISTFPLTLLDVISGLEKAVSLGWYDVRTFDIAEYCRLRCHDCSWVIPHSILTLSSPNDKTPGKSSKIYAKLFQQLKVTHLVQLNEPLYRKAALRAIGIQLTELAFPDGSTPSDDIINRFMQAIEPTLLLKSSSLGEQKSKTVQNSGERIKEKLGIRGGIEKRLRGQLSCGDRPKVKSNSCGSSGAVAVHCYSGLGRTGTLICAYMMLQFNFTARESMGWIRLCRPGSVVGAQQIFLETLERRILRSANITENFCADCNASVVGSGLVDKKRGYRYKTHNRRLLLATTPSYLQSSKADVLLGETVEQKYLEASVRKGEVECKMLENKQQSPLQLPQCPFSFSLPSPDIKSFSYFAASRDSFATRSSFCSHSEPSSCTTMTTTTTTVENVLQKCKSGPVSFSAKKSYILPISQSVTPVIKERQGHNVDNTKKNTDRANNAAVSSFFFTAYTAKPPKSSCVLNIAGAVVCQSRPEKSFRNTWPNLSASVGSRVTKTYNKNCMNVHCKRFKASNICLNDEGLIATNAAARQLGSVPFFLSFATNMSLAAQKEQIKTTPAWGVEAMQVNM